MAAMHVQDVVLNEADDDDGMPPLVDNPYPSMTLTFATDMTPITYSTDPTAFELPPEGAPANPFVFSPPTSPSLGPTRVSHAKKRDASYIPRPQNAFILFRSSFIRAQHIPGKIEGNHSSLSKIIGKYWKALPREDREIWEAKAIIAQAEHRKRYPDWRFRPGANALAKVKDGPKRRCNRKGRGQAEKEEHSRDKRCAKIADLLVAGKTGLALEAAIEEYDSAAGGATPVKEEGRGDAHARPQSEQKDLGLTDAPTQVTQAERPVVPGAAARNVADGMDPRCMTPDPASDGRFKVPLTAMFKRSSSAPASHSRSNSGSFEEKPRAPAGYCTAAVAVPSPAADVSCANYMAAPPGKHEDEPRVGSFAEKASGSAAALRADSVSATQQPVLEFYNSGEFAPFSDSPHQWDQTCVGSPAESGCWSPPTAAFEPDREAFLSQSPASVAYNIPDGDVFWNYHATQHGVTPDEQCRNLAPSSYSSLKGWAGDVFAKCGPATPSNGQPFIMPPYADTTIMADAFAAAGAAVYGEWHAYPGAVDWAYRPWGSPGRAEGLHDYAPVPGMMGRPDDGVFFN